MQRGFFNVDMDDGGDFRRQNQQGRQKPSGKGGRKNPGRKPKFEVRPQEASFVSTFIDSVSGYRVVAQIARALRRNNAEHAKAYAAFYAGMAVLFGVLAYVFDLKPTIAVSESVANALISAGLVAATSASILRVFVVAVSLIPTASEFFGGAMALEGSYFVDKLIIGSVLFDLWTDYPTSQVAGKAISGVLFGHVAALAPYMGVLDGIVSFIFLIAASWAFEVLTLSFLLAAVELYKSIPRYDVR